MKIGLPDYDGRPNGPELPPGSILTDKARAALASTLSEAATAERLQRSEEARARAKARALQQEPAETKTGTEG